MRDTVTAMLFIIICLLTAALVFLVYKYKKMEKMADKTMAQMDDMLEQLILGREVKYFSENEDTLPGKFQSQAGRLYEIHRVQEEREKLLRDQISSSVSDLVHQINTPIANIKMYGEFLREDSLTTEEYRHFADNLDRQARKLSWLGEGFAKISRMETGIISLKPEIQPVLPVILEAVDQAALKAEQHGNDIRLKGDQKLKACLDRRWTEEVFFNLLDNAVKYSDPGSVILVELLEYEMYIRINVCSRGTKVKREEFARVFQRFYRGKNAEDQEGVGLGLYLAREIIRGQRGYMKGEYDPEKGNVFSVFLCR